MLCFRCEWRAQFLEKKRQPRMECGEIKSSKIACYMYKPVRPVVMSRLYSEKDDPRPAFGGYFGCRMKGERVVGDDEVSLEIREMDDGNSMSIWR